MRQYCPIASDRRCVLIDAWEGRSRSYSVTGGLLFFVASQDYFHLVL